MDVGTDRMFRFETCDAVLGVMSSAMQSPASEEDRLTAVLHGLRAWLGLRIARGGWVKLVPGAIAPEVLAGLESGELERPQQLALALYDADYTAITDPAMNEIMARLNGEAITMRRQDLIPDSAWYGSEFVDRIARPSGLDCAMYSAVPINSVGEYFALTLVRAWGEPPFSEEERDALTLLHHRLTPLFSAWTRERAGRRAISELPTRMRQVLACLLEGDSEKHAATRLDLSPHTVHQYVKRLHRVMRVRSRGELLAYCRLVGVTPAALREERNVVRRIV